MSARTFDFGEYRVVQDGEFWTLQKARTRLVRATGESRTTHESFSYFATLDQALAALLRQLADNDPQAATVGGYIERIKALWAEMERVVQDGLKGGAR